MVPFRKAGHLLLTVYFVANTHMKAIYAASLMIPPPSETFGLNQTFSTSFRSLFVVETATILMSLYAIENKFLCLIVLTYRSDC